MWPETRHEKEALDRYITGNYGEDQFKNEKPKLLLCAKWGRCKATKKCPLEKRFSEMEENMKVYVLGECIGFNNGIVVKKEN